MKKFKPYQRKLAGILLSLSLIVTSVCQGTFVEVKAADSSEISYKVTYGQTEARSMLDALNTWRTSDTWQWDSSNNREAVTGRSALQYDAGLEQIAMQRAAEIALHYSHTRPSGADTWSAYGSISAYGAVGENIAAGYNSYTTAASVLEGWKEENENYAGQGHRRNMLNENFNYIGIGHVYVNGAHYWVQEFSKNPTGETLPAANDTEAVASTTLSSSYLTNLELTLDSTSAELGLTESTSCSLPTANVFVQTGEIWPNSFKMQLISPEPAWEISSGNAVTLEGTTVTAVSAGTAILTASVTVAGTTKTADFTITVSDVATAEPSTEPSAEPSAAASEAPSASPSEEPSALPSVSPSASPSVSPSASPAASPSASPAVSPSALPSVSPSASPSVSPSASPAASPSASPVASPSASPVVSPSASPAVSPSVSPSSPDSTVKTPEKVTSLSVKNKKGKRLAISWKKINGTTGYQIQYALNKAFTKSSKKKTTANTSITLKSLKKKKTYYIRVRAYTKKGSVIKYGKWSTVKKVKIKK